MTGVRADGPTALPARPPHPAPGAGACPRWVRVVSGQPASRDRVACLAYILPPGRVSRLCRAGRSRQPGAPLTSELLPAADNGSWGRGPQSLLPAPLTCVDPAEGEASRGLQSPPSSLGGGGKYVPRGRLPAPPVWSWESWCRERRAGLQPPFGDTVGPHRVLWSLPGRPRRRGSSWALRTRWLPSRHSSSGGRGKTLWKEPKVPIRRLLFYFIFFRRLLLCWWLLQ